MSLRTGLKRVWLGYNNVLQKHALIVQSVQTSALLGLGDLGAQTFFENPLSSYDYSRTIRYL